MLLFTAHRIPGKPAPLVAEAQRTFKITLQISALEGKFEGEQGYTHQL